MKAAKIVLPFLVIVALAFVISGCPKKKMMGDSRMSQTANQTVLVG